MLSDLFLRLRSLFRRDAVEPELDDELRFHLEQQVDSYLRHGLSRDEAVRRARLEFGGLDQIKEAHRDARGIGLVSHVGRDLRHALRQFRRSPGFTALAVLCLGLAIGVNTSIFGVLNSVLFRPMPVQQPDRLVVISRGDVATFSYPTYRDFRDRSRTLSGLAASLPSESDLDVDGDSTFVAAEAVSGNYSASSAREPLLDDGSRATPSLSAVISYAAWQRHFNLSPDVLGRTVRSESQSYTVVGVAAREFSGIFSPLRTDLWVPIGTRPSMVALMQNRESAPDALRPARRRRTPARHRPSSRHRRAIGERTGARRQRSRPPDRRRSGSRHRECRQPTQGAGRGRLPDSRRQPGAADRLCERRQSASRSWSGPTT